MQVRTIKDTAMMGLPAEEIPAAAVKDGVVDLDIAQELRRKLHDAGLLLAAGQGERALLMQSQSWTVTNDPAVVQTWDLACACPTCYENRDAGVIYLRENPDRFMAFCDMEYTQVRSE